MLNIIFSIILCIILFYVTNNFILKNYKKSINIENFISLYSNETFQYSLNESFKILNKKRLITYNGKSNSAINRQIILFNTINKLDHKEYTILRWIDFRNERLRHSKKYCIDYFEYLKKNFIKQNINYIFDFVGYHGILDDKVRLWIKLKEVYGRDLANTIMPKTYLIPNDYELFMKDYHENKKYILKNSFGGARSSIKITRSKKEILDIFNKNKLNNFNPYSCEDAVCYSDVKYNIIQEFIQPSFLLNGYKMGIRLYVVLLNSDNNSKRLLWKDGMCYYSKKKYVDDENMDNNVVGSIKKIGNVIKNNNFPVSYLDFKEYSKKNIKDYGKKFKNFELKINKYLDCILTSNKDELFYFNEYQNIKKFSIFGFDIEFDENFNPVIYEGNYYFARFTPNTNYGTIIENLYHDIFYELGLSKNSKYGFFNI